MGDNSSLTSSTNDLSAEDVLTYLEALLEIGQGIDLSCFECVKDFEGSVPRYAEGASFGDETMERLIVALFYDALGDEDDRKEFLRDNFLSRLWLNDCIAKLRTVKDDKRYLAMANLIAYNPDDFGSLCLTLRLNLAHCCFVTELTNLLLVQISNQIRNFCTKFIPTVVQKLEDFSQHQDKLCLDEYFNTRASVLALTDLEQEKQDLLAADKQFDDLTSQIQDTHEIVENCLTLFDHILYDSDDNDCFKKACAMEKLIQGKIQDLVMGDHPRINMSQLYVDHALLDFQFRKFKTLYQACETKMAHFRGGNIYLLYALLFF